MIKPFRFDKLFKINPDATVLVENDCLIIDNFFSYYDKVLDYVNNNNVEIWKYSPTSKNFIDYYDCRHRIQNYWFESTEFDNKIVSLINHCYNCNVSPVSGSSVEFNYFKHLKRNIPEKYQHHPHVDYDFNLLVYLDEQSNGGTAIYDVDSHMKNNERENLLCDVSSFKKMIVKAQPNRCVIFNGHQYHGGHIDDHDVYYDNWRINLVKFYERILS